MISSVRLQQFRSYVDAPFEFGPGVNIIVGPNASGKTNLLEAVLVLAQGKSYRAKDSELVQTGTSWARLDAYNSTSTRTVKMEGDPAKKQFAVDGQTFTRLHHQRTMPAVLFEPDHLLLLSGSPDLRRAFLDDLIEQAVPDFGAVRRHYKRVLSQRNSLLKKNPPHLREQVFVWNIRLSELGGKIAAERQTLVSQIQERMSDLYSGLAGHKSTVTIQYISAFPPESYETALLQKLEQSLEQDMLRGYTANGPHRDDISLSIDGQPVQETASRGEVRTLVLALKIIELHTLERIRGQKPLLLLDDVFSELDGKRRQALTVFVHNYQTFITTTDADMALRHFADSTIIPTTDATQAHQMD